MANWFDLPKDLLERICNICIAPDQIRMQCVCRSWRSILKKIIHRELPWLMMLPNEEDDKHQDARFFFSLSKQKTHIIHLPEMRGKRCCGSFQNGWLMMVDEELDMCLFHPWTKKKINLPQSHLSIYKDQIREWEPLTMEEMRDESVRKAALSDDGEVLVVIGRKGYSDLWRIGDEAYTPINRGWTLLDDVVYHKGRFYALSQSSSVYVLHIEDEPHWEELTPELQRSYTICGYLVPDILTDSMFVITRQVGTTGEVKFLDDDRDTDDLYPGHKTIHFDICSVALEEESKAQTKFTKIESLGDRVLFLGFNSSIITLASQFPGLRGNCIYFADNMIGGYWCGIYGCRDSGVFRLEDRKVEKLFAYRFHPIVSPPLWIAIPPYSSSRDFGREKLCLQEPHDDVCT